SIVPFPDVDSDGKASRVAPERVRTRVRETVQILGVNFEAYGVPFMEQDGRLLRCAHVSAWICHYTATLRGYVARRTTGQFHAAGAVNGTVGRSFPSNGLNVVLLS